MNPSPRSLRTSWSLGSGELFRISTATLPGRILWLLLTLREQESRDVFLNRELRLHPLLKLPAYRDNLEARLLMLQRRLLDKGAALRISRERRGRLILSSDLRVKLELVRS